MRAVFVVVVSVLILGCGYRGAEIPTQAGWSSEQAYENPVDGITYFAPGGWERHLPDTPRPDNSAKKVKCEQLRLLTAQDDIAARTTVDDLAEFLREAERLADETLGKGSGEFKLIAQFKCTEEGHDVRLAHQGDAAADALQAYYDALAAARKLPVKEGEVSFQLEMSVRP